MARVASYSLFKTLSKLRLESPQLNLRYCSRSVSGALLKEKDEKSVGGFNYFKSIIQENQGSGSISESSINTEDNLTQLPAAVNDDLANIGAVSETVEALSTDVDPNFIDDIGPPLSPTFNLAAYANKSFALQQLVHLGVDLSLCERKAGMAKYLLNLDFEKDMKGHIQFLCDVGVPPKELGPFLTKNPLIFKESIDDLQVRINYLESKKFDKEGIVRILTGAPHFIMFSTKRIDERLGHFQKLFELTGNEVRHVTTKLPKLIIYNMHSINENIFALRQEMGFAQAETKQLFLNTPRLFIASRSHLVPRFDYIHNTMGIPHELILKFPGCLLKRKFLVEQRHKYLVLLGRAQYDPKEPNYVSLHVLISGSDADFCTNAAKTTVAEYNDFLKTL